MRWTRPLACIASLVLLTSALVGLFPDRAFACSCAALPGTPQERAEKALAGSSAVFSGEVVEFEKPPPDTEMIEGTMLTVIGGGGSKATVTLRASEVWKGSPQQTVTITTEADSDVGCGYPFVEGERYLVYATEGEPSVSLCGETKPLSEADADLALLGNSSEKPEDGVGTVLSDTSGGISVGAMVALAGLALTGSFVLAVRLLRAG